MGDFRVIEREHQDIIKLQDLGDSYEKSAGVIGPDGQPVNHDIWAVKISSNPEVNDPNKPDIYITAGIHARELIGVETARTFVKNIAENYNSNPQIKELIDKSEIYVIPMINPDGHEIVFQQKGNNLTNGISVNEKLWRKNYRGVDLNRNFGTSDFGETRKNGELIGTSRNPQSEVYCGLAGFSEPETQVIRDFITNQAKNGNPPATLIDLHSYSNFIMYPPDNSRQPVAENEQFKNIAEQTAKEVNLSGGENYRAISGTSRDEDGEHETYLVTGSITEWVYEKYKIPSICIEIGKEEEQLYAPPENRLISTTQSLVPGIIKGVSLATNSPLPKTLAEPGGDYPDEFVGINDFLADEKPFPLEVYSAIKSSIVVLGHGFWFPFVQLADSSKNAVKYLPLNELAPSLAEKYPILIIPSGGLYGLDNSEIFKTTLAEYVNQGGTVICLSQQHGYEFNALPGGKLAGYGWLEDQACHANAVYIDTYHQILSGQIKATPDFVVDGYFSILPDNSTVILRRTANSQPCLITYPYGKGRVFATTMYEDWAYAHGQSTTQGRALVRDLVSFAKATSNQKPEYSNQINEYKPGDNVSLELSIKSLGFSATDINLLGGSALGGNDKNATQAKVYFLSPERNILSFATQRSYIFTNGFMIK